jgi:hypothetical protein
MEHPVSHTSICGDDVPLGGYQLTALAAAIARQLQAEYAVQALVSIMIQKSSRGSSMVCGCMWHSPVMCMNHVRLAVVSTPYHKNGRMTSLLVGPCVAPHLLQLLLLSGQVSKAGGVHPTLLLILPCHLGARHSNQQGMGGRRSQSGGQVGMQAAALTQMSKSAWHVTQAPSGLCRSSPDT